MRSRQILQCIFLLGMVVMLVSFQRISQDTSEKHDVNRKQRHKAQRTMLNRLSQPPRLDLSRATTFVTHMTMERLPSLARIAKSWPGPIAVAVYSKHPDDLAVIQAIGHPLLKAAATPYNPAIHYPVNILRNKAMDLVTTDLVFLVDVDFVPSDGLYAYLEAMAVMIRAAANNTVFVVPAFELDRGQPIPQPPFQKPQLEELVGKAVARPCLEKAFPAAHVYHTDFPKWYKAKEQYEITYKFPFEPYIVAKASRMPRFDERFVHYGDDKVQLFYDLFMQAFHFIVIPDHFITHISHELAGWANPEVRASHLDEVTKLVETFKGEMDEKIRQREMQEAADNKPQDDKTLMVIKIREGDSLWKIAHRYQTSIDGLKWFNNMPTDMISIGQAIKIPKPEAMMEWVKLQE